METINVKLFDDDSVLRISGEDLNVTMNLDFDGLTTTQSYGLLEIWDGQNLLLIAPMSNVSYVVREDVLS